MITLKNQWLTAQCTEAGAELKSLKDAEGVEYLFDDKTHWNYTSPHLFPVIGMLKNNALLHEGRHYPMARHGLARTSTFTLLCASPEQANFRLASDSSTLKIYPFPFDLEVQYRLEGLRLTVTFIVKNPGTQTLPFALGAHPAFRIPRNPKEHFVDYHLRFQKKEQLHRHPIDSKTGLLSRKTVPMGQDTLELALDYALFEEDALVFSGLHSTYVDLVPPKPGRILRMHIGAFPFLGLWTARRGAPFFCIEPWFGHADFEDFEGSFLEKEDNIHLAPGTQHSLSYALELRP